MNEKLSFQHVSDALAQKAGVSKKVADIFTKAFFDTVVDAFYMGEESVKVKGLGTFKLVEVESRESVNVSNGERIVIPGYKKVSFTPEDGVVEFLSSIAKASERGKSLEEAPAAEEIPAVGEVPAVEEAPAVEETPATEEVPVEEATSASEEVVPVVEIEETPAVEEASVAEEAPSAEEEVEALIQVPDPVNVEEPQDAFSGIDMLISTPESMDEVRQQYEEAKTKMETAVEEARKANAEKVRLEKLLARLEANAVPETREDVKDEPETDEAQGEAALEVQGEAVAEAKEETVNNPSVEKETVVDSAEQDEVPQDTASEEDKHQEAFNRFINETPRMEEQPSESKHSHTLAWVLILVFALLAGICFFLYQTFLSIEAVETVPEVEKTEVKKVSAPHTVKPGKVAKPDASQASAPKQEDSKAVAPKADAPKKEEPKADVAKKVEQKEIAPKKDAQVKKEEVKPAKPARPATHVLQRGESLTRISQKYYGTKDSVRAIFRVNTFNDPDNLPVGAVVKLP